MASSSRQSDTSFIWTVKNFEMCPHSWGKPLKSPEFCIWQMSSFHLLFYARGVNKKNSDYVSVYLVKSNDRSEANHTYSGELGIVTSEGKTKCFSFKDEFKYSNGKGTATFVSRGELLSVKRRDAMLPDGDLTVYCDISLAKDASLASSEIQTHLKEYSSIFAGLYRSEEYSDVSILTKAKTFKVHRILLEERFPDLLKGMKNNKCEAKGIGSDTMDALLKYVYTGVLDLGDVNIFELLASGIKLPAHLKYLLAAKCCKVKATTCFEKMVSCFTWTFQNFSKLECGKVLRYPLVADEGRTWTWLTILLTVPKSEAEEDYVFSIEKFSPDCKQITCKVKTLDIVETFDHSFDDTLKEEQWTLPVFFTKKLLTEKRKFRSDEISVEFEIAVSNGSQKDEIEKKEFFQRLDSTEQAVQDMGSLRKALQNIFNNPKSTDVTLISGKDKISAHKCILSGRSSVFANMCQAKAGNRDIVIDDLETQVVKDMLAYIYFDQIQFSLADTKHVIGMYNAANKYNLLGLRRECANLLKLSLRADNAGDILISADKWNDDDLKELVYNYICMHPQEIAKCKKWEATMLERRDIAVEVLRRTLSHLATRKKE